ncbi:hypothetical protein ADL22_24320 [Streptomyces sp. NRRL F-4489]|uniref:WXG100 family type VII secretion target n=1 Tax=Streptomyces sp. NRRL F-4489 TaxID=1609095 RepID=UPI0007478529|nr:hypothetical protein [Streptomyces sp. NRRL F-4489]KUL36424.1 hypothetical protein ADL22_24320 [Streptomyces sp. NRRL F-4489]
MGGSEQFTVDVEELGSLATRLRRCTESMEYAGGDLRSATVGDLGHSRIDEAGAEFKSSWEYGIRQIRDLTDAIKQGLEATARAYNETDGAVRQAFAKGIRGSDGGNGTTAATSPFG